MGTKLSGPAKNAGANQKSKPQKGGEKSLASMSNKQGALGTLGKRSGLSMGRGK